MAPPSSSRNVEYIQNQVMTSASPQLKTKLLFKASSPGPTAVLAFNADLGGLKTYVYPINKKKNINLTGAITMSASPYSHLPVTHATYLEIPSKLCMVSRPCLWL